MMNMSVKRGFSNLLLFCSLAVSTVSAAAVSAHGVTTDATQAANQTFDYIVVGAGLTGLTVASRLSEDPNVKVLVVEVGGDDRNDPRVYDLLQSASVYGSNLDWAWSTDQNRTISGGKTLGGSSSINGAAYTRASTAQYDAISDLLEPEDRAVGWNAESLFSYMRKSETFTPPNATQVQDGADYVPQYHGTAGPLHVAYPVDMFAGPQQPAFIQALQNATGIHHSKDLNGGLPNSVSITPMTLNPGDSGYRSSSAQAYLSPVEQSRQNWLIVISHMVTKINFKNDELPLIATGIEFSPINSTTRYQAFASKEVILGAGAIQTPALLQLSGIGDSSLLEPLGIPTLLNHTTVGKNLQEQTLDLVAAQSSGFDPKGAGPQDAIAFPNLYQLFGDDAKNAVQNITSSISAWAESQAQHAISTQALEEIFKLQAKLVIDHTSPLFELFFITTPDFVGMSMWNLLPFSRGSVEISSSDPFTKPVVDVNYFGVDFDMKVQVHGTRLARKVLQTAPLSSLIAKEIAPGDAVPDDAAGGSDADWEAWIKTDFNANSHPIATAAMMRRDLGGVVDARLKVYDTTNLRIVDASILPMQLSAHLSGSLYGVAEKAADLIKADQHKY